MGENVCKIAMCSRHTKHLDMEVARIALKILQSSCYCEIATYLKEEDMNLSLFNLIAT